MVRTAKEMEVMRWNLNHCQIEDIVEAMELVNDEGNYYKRKILIL